MNEEIGKEREELLKRFKKFQQFISEIDEFPTLPSTGRVLLVEKAKIRRFLKKNSV